MKSKLKFSVLALALCAGFAFSAPSFADDHSAEHTMEKAKDATKEAANDTKRAAKKAGRNAKQKGCELVNGKMECAGKAITNKVKDAGAAMEDAVD